MLDPITIPARLPYFDNDGFFALADERYAAHLGPDWILDELAAAFAAAGADGSLAIAYLEPELAMVRLSLLDAPSGRPALDEHRLPLRVTSGRVWLTPYEALVAVAEDEATTLRSQVIDHEQSVTVPNGSYVVTIRVLVVPDLRTVDERRPQTWPELEVVIAPGVCPAPARIPGADILLS